MRLVCLSYSTNPEIPPFHRSSESPDRLTTLRLYYNASRLRPQAQEEATTIQAESAETKTLAARLRDDAAQLNVDVADTAGNIDVYEMKVGGAGCWNGVPGGRLVGRRGCSQEPPIG